MSIGFDTWGPDNPRQPDYVAAKAAGVSFGYFKRTQHVLPDTGLTRGDVTAARAAGLIVGEYHMPGWGLRASAARTQVIAFKKAGPAPIRNVDLPPGIDLEGFKNCGWSMEQVAKFVVELVKEFELQMNVTPFIYTSFFQIDDLGAAAALLEPLKRCSLFLKTAYVRSAGKPYDASLAPRAPHCGPADWDPKNYHRVPEPWASHGGHFIEQWDGDATGFPGHAGQVDVDRWHVLAPGYRGPEVLQLRAWCANPNAVSTALSEGDLTYDDSLAVVVAARQAASGLVADSLVGPQTIALLAWR